MNDSDFSPVFPSQPSDFDSRDCINVIVDLQGDNTPRPLRPQLMKFALAERERLARLREQMGQAPHPVEGTENSSQESGK